MDVTNSISTGPGNVRDQHKVQASDQLARKAQERAGRQISSDAATLSERALLLQKLSEAVDESPEIREEKVAALREAVEKGTYQPSALEIAKAMLASRQK